MRDPTMGAYSANPVGSPNFTAGYQGAALKLGTHTHTHLTALCPELSG